MLIKIITTLSVLTFTTFSWAADFNYLTVAQGLAKATGTGNNTGVGNEADLYQQIATEFGQVYEAIGKKEADGVLTGNGLSVTGGLNSIGFSYKRPFINFGVSVDRNLAPDLFDNKRWIVTDTFSVDIDASKVLGGLRDSGAINMSEQNLAAFAGIVFKRKFTWIHYANSYQEGLTTEFEKLFLPFNALTYSNITKLDPNEMVFKEDSISVKAGGVVSAPLYTGVTGMAGVLAKFERLSRVEVVSLGDSRLQISSEKTNITTAGVSLGIQADFLNILKMTLLSYDFSYSLESSYKVYLNMNQMELIGLEAQSPVAMEVSQILKNREGDLDILAPYIISEEKRISQITKHKYNFLLLGAQKSSKTQQIEITKDGKVKNFFRHYYEKMKYTEDVVSRLFASLVYALTNSDISATQLANDTKKVTIEYDSERNLLENRESLDVGEKTSGEQKLSMTFLTDFKTQKTTGLTGRKFKDRARFILERFSGVDPLALAMIDRDYLKAPFHVEGNYQVNIDGIRYLNSQKISTVFDHFDGLCNEYPKTSFLNFRNMFDNCRNSLQNDYIDYVKDLTHDRVSSDDITACESKAKKFTLPAKKRAFIKNCLAEINLLPEGEWVNVPLWPLKNLSSNIVNNSYSKVHFYNLFGVQNVFFFGSFDAVTADGRAFTTSFHEGAFKGLGAVDHYMRVENLRAPSSVVVDE
ncbi:hypothetical protein SHI21_17755 [Bacteriovorax sp. PP10]|uniref:Uncharacterized protein n=1 Tax=Bacteriovorax antarcticus TaxID=3088717 RepID=A0ABU5VYE3_9BACT|nr:hypothetical protein [Bacteriovorax sp. PP10]MEA9358083.1 hypothetical protein [Bacteriovorax sp. PP10]